MKAVVKRWCRAAALLACLLGWGLEAHAQQKMTREEYIATYAPLAIQFNQELKDMFIQQTRLQLVNSGGDLEIDGEIVGYNQYNQGVDASGYSSEVKLTLTVNVRYVNNTNHEEDFEQQFSAFQTYESTQLLTAVQDQLIPLMIEDITEQIFNSTVANW